MPVWREAGAGQPVYVGFEYVNRTMDKELITLEVHHGGRIVKNKQNKCCYTGGSVGYLDWCTVEYINMLEMWEQVKLLGHMGKVSLKGVVNDELLDIDKDAELHWATEGIGPLNNDKEGRPFTEDHGPARRVEDWVSSDDNEPLNNEGSRVDIGDTDMEDSEGSEEEDKEEDPDFVDSAYEQSENECELLTKDDKAFENYVDHSEVVEDPNSPIDEDRESTDVAKSDVESLDSSSYDEDDGNQKKRKKKQPKFQEFRPETDMPNPMFKLGLKFATTYLFRKAIRNYSIVNRRMIKFKCNDRAKVRAVCAGNCKWVCFASAVNGSEWVQVKKLVDEHDCGTVDHNFHANSTWARQKATSISEGTYVKQYELLWDYTAELRRTNVGSTVIIKCELEGERPRFQRICIYLAAVKQGFLHGCRPVIGFDACHIKGHHPEQLLSVVGVDPNNGMYPIVYAVAEVESYETWSWFCQLLVEDLGIENSSGYVFIIDKQKGLIDAVNDNFPNAEHRHCPKSMYAKLPQRKTPTSNPKLSPS
ncbi:unnamed protein product [Prunus armeniaca]